MRVIAGKYKSRVLKDFTNQATRPTLDRVKESIFSKIHFNCENAVVLDLFAGTGGLGIEALSRGAKHAYFVDKNKIAYNLIKQNIQTLNETDNVTIYNCDYNIALEQLKNQNVKFDLVLLDPPYKQNLGIKAIEKILEYQLLNDDAVVILECSAQEEIKQFEEFEQTETKKYGTVNVIYYIK